MMRSLYRRLLPVLALTLLIGTVLLLFSQPAAAAGNKVSDRAETLFFYANDSSGAAVLLKAVSYDELAAMAHGSDATDSSSTYSQSYIDAMPTPTYKEGRGVTISELLDYVKSCTSVSGAAQLTYAGTDRLYFTCTDGASANFTYNALLGVDRYYYPDLYQYWDRSEGTVDEDHIQTVLDSGVPTEVYLATMSAGGRVLAEDAGYNGTIADYVAANNGVVTGCMSQAGQLISDEALTLCFGQTASDIEISSATYSSVKKWVYSVRLRESGTSPITSQGTVSAPQCRFILNGTTLAIILSCSDEGASIYYSTVGGSTTAPLQLYTGPIIISDYDISQPFDLGVQAVREGWVSSAKQVFDSDDHETAPLFIKHSLLLSDEIGVKFRVSFPEGFDTTGCYVDFVADDGRTLTVQYANAETITGSTDRYFTCGVNALELADNITATLYYGNGKTLTDEYSVMKYITYVQENLAANTKLLKLVNALQEYGYYMQGSGWTDDKASHIPIPAPASPVTRIKTAKNAVSGMAIVKELDGSGITDAKFSVTLNAKTALNVSVKPDAGVTIKTTGYKKKTINGATYYQYTRSNIGPKKLGTAYPFVVKTSAGTATVTASAMSYVYAVLNSTAFTNAQQLAMAAYYNYYAAAAAY